MACCLSLDGQHWVLPKTLSCAIAYIPLCLRSPSRCAIRSNRETLVKRLLQRCYIFQQFVDWGKEREDKKSEVGSRFLSVFPTSFMRSGREDLNLRRSFFSSTGRRICGGVERDKVHFCLYMSIMNSPLLFGQAVNEAVDWNGRWNVQQLLAIQKYVLRMRTLIFRNMCLTNIRSLLKNSLMKAEFACIEREQEKERLRKILEDLWEAKMPDIVAIS